MERLTYRKVIAAIYEQDTNIVKLSGQSEIHHQHARKALRQWIGKTGNPRGKTRKFLKRVEEIIGQPVYTEAA